MTKSEMAGQARGPGLTGEDRPRPAVVVGGQATDTALPSDLCAFSRHFPSDSTHNPQLPTGLRVALVDGDERVHDFV